MMMNLVLGFPEGALVNSSCAGRDNLEVPGGGDRTIDRGPGSIRRFGEVIDDWPRSGAAGRP